MNLLDIFGLLASSQLTQVVLLKNTSVLSFLFFLSKECVVLLDILFGFKRFVPTCTKIEIFLVNTSNVMLIFLTYITLERIIFISLTILHSFYVSKLWCMSENQILFYLQKTLDFYLHFFLNGDAWLQLENQLCDFIY